MECAAVRLAGAGSLWGEKDFIQASPETLAFVTAVVLGGGIAVVCTIYSSHDGSNVAVLKTAGDAGEQDTYRIDLFNPVGVHFDPLWRMQKAGQRENRPP